MAGKIPLNPPTGTKAQALNLGKHLGLKAIHEMPDGKFHPGMSHRTMVNAIQRHNRGVPE
jgi:hypothetical protein